MAEYLTKADKPGKAIVCPEPLTCLESQHRKHEFVHPRHSTVEVNDGSPKMLSINPASTWFISCSFVCPAWTCHLGTEWVIRRWPLYHFICWCCWKHCSLSDFCQVFSCGCFRGRHQCWCRYASGSDLQSHDRCHECFLLVKQGGSFGYKDFVRTNHFCWA